MAAQFSYLNFLRQIPDDLLMQYFASKNIDLEIDFKKLKKKRENTIFHTITELNTEQQIAIESGFLDINALACDGGMAALIDEANFHEDYDFVEFISEIDGLHAKAMLAFLKRNHYWRAATLFLRSDNVCSSYWEKRNDLPKTPSYSKKSDITELEKAISAFFHRKQGRGRNCQVEVYCRNNKEYFFAYPENFGQKNAVWEGGILKIRADHPAFEIIFTYCQEEGSLDIYAPKNNKAIPALQKIFAQTILHLNDLSDRKKDKRVYDLEPIANSNFEFQIEPTSGIADVVVNKLRLTLKHGLKQRLILEADTKDNKKAIYDLLKKINPPPFFVTQVELLVNFESKDGKSAKTRIFSISHPNYCKLNYDGDDLLIRELLAKSGIEIR